MAIILSLETSTTVCSVALHDSGKLIVGQEITTPQSHASRLAPLIDEVRRSSGIELKQLAAVAIASGPGSYTGLRIGTSTAKGLCYSLNIPLIAVETLDVMAHQVLNKDEGFLCPMIDARRMEVYCKVFDADLKVVRQVEAKIIDEQSFADLLAEKPVLFFGDGAAKCRVLLQHERAFFLDDIHPTAVQLGVQAYQAFTLGRVEDVVHFEPFYLKDFLIRKPAGTV